MFIRKKLNKSGTTSIQVINKSSGYKVVKSFGSAKDPKQIKQLEMEARNFILGNQQKLFSFKTKEESKLSVLEHIFQPEVYPELYKDFSHVVRINYYPPRGDNKEGWDAIDIFGWLGYKMQIKIDFMCRDSILAAPLALDLALFMDLAQRAGMRGIQEWLSFYFKAPQTAPGLYPEHDLFIQLMKLKNTLRHMRGEELITHLGLEYYD